jgi:capsular polysaccharide biosynthesis protein
MKQDKIAILLNEKLKIIFILSLICTGLASSVYIALNPIQYESHTSVYISNSNSHGDSEITYMDMFAGNSLVGNYVEIAESGLLAESIIKKFSLEHIAPEAIAESIEAKQTANSNVLSISVHHENKIFAERIARSIPALLSELQADIPITGFITVLNKPSEAEPVIWRILIAVPMFFICSLLISVILFLLLRPNSNIIRTPADVERTLGLKVSGTIPDFTF